MEKLIRKCFFCGKEVSQGIIVNGEMICPECESNIIKTSAEEKKYDEYKDKIKIILYK